MFRLLFVSWYSYVVASYAMEPEVSKTTTTLAFELSDALLAEPVTLSESL